MEIKPIDPRTDPRWETPPTHDYRVIFWNQSVGPKDVPQELVMWAAYETDVLGASDVHEVIEWADEEALRRKSMYTLFAKVDIPDHPGLVWLAGVDPTAWSRPNFQLQRPLDATPAAGGTEAYRSPDNPTPHSGGRV